MNRGIRLAARWRLAYWTAVAPGKRGSWCFALAPALFFVPWESVGLFATSHQAVLAVTWLAAAGLGLGVGSGRSLRSEDTLWLFQKGIPLGEVALEDWALDAGLLTTAAAWWAIFGAAALAGTSPPVYLWAGLFAFAVGTALLARTISGFLSAWGSARPSDLTGVVALVSMMASILLAGRPGDIERTVHWLLPPFIQAGNLLGAIRAGDRGDASASALHLLGFVGALLAATAWRMHHWRPKG